jgi:hypothetical protein
MTGLKDKLSRADVDRIIAEGSEREKMLLYLTGIAEQQVEPYEVETLFIRAVFPKQGREKTPEPVKLTEEESRYLHSCIVSRKGLAQYNRMRAVHSRFLYFKERFNVDLMRLQAISFAISVYSPSTTKWLTYTDAENITEQDRLRVWAEAIRFAHLAPITATDCKYGITLFKQALSKELPLKPYSRWVKEQEKQLITILEEIHSKTSGREDYPADAPQVQLWEDIVVEVDPQDIEDFKLGI